MKLPTWKDVLLANTTSTRGVAGNRDLASYESAADGKGTARNVVRNITEDEEGVLLAGDEEKKIIFIHCIKNLGGVRSRPENKVIGNIGLSNKASTVIINEDLWEIPLNLRAPSAKSLLECTSAGEAKDETATAAFRTLRGIIIPPWAVECLLTMETEEEIDPFEAIITLVRGAKEFDKKHEEDKSYTELAVDHIVSCFVSYGVWEMRKYLRPPFRRTKMMTNATIIMQPLTKHPSIFRLTTTPTQQKSYEIVFTPKEGKGRSPALMALMKKRRTKSPPKSPGSSRRH